MLRDISLIVVGPRLRGAARAGIFDRGDLGGPLVAFGTFVVIRTFVAVLPFATLRPVGSLLRPLGGTVLSVLLAGALGPFARAILAVTMAVATAARCMLLAGRSRSAFRSPQPPSGRTAPRW
jgi:hypothetical protein